MPTQRVRSVQKSKGGTMMNHAGTTRARQLYVTRMDNPTEGHKMQKSNTSRSDGHDVLDVEVLQQLLSQAQ
jgi:hypothetical protein